jgi:hypothetical protein
MEEILFCLIFSVPRFESWFLTLVPYNISRPHTPKSVRKDLKTCHLASYNSGFVHISLFTTISQLKFCDFCRRNFWRFLKFYNYLGVQKRHNCSPAASFANWVLKQYLLKVHLLTFPSIPITQKCQIYEMWHFCRKRVTYTPIFQLDVRSKREVSLVGGTISVV